MRGIAMILIAVAVLLLLWWVFQMTGNSGDKNDQAAGVSTTTSAAANPTASAPADPAGTPAEGTAPADAQNPQNPDGQPESTAPSAAPAPGELQIHVLNNSTIQGLAADVADKIQANGEVTNLATVELPNSVVYFSPADEARALEIADQLGITAQPKIPEVEGYDGIVVVVTQDLEGTV